MAKLSLSRAWDETKSVLARDGRLLVPVALALLVFPQTLLGAVAPVVPADIGLGFQLVLLIAILTAVAGQIALNRLAIPPSATVGAGIVLGMKRMPVVLLALIIAFLAAFVLFVIVAVILIMVGLVEAPVPGRPPSLGLFFILALVFAMFYSIFQLAVPIGAVEGGGSIRLIRRSWQVGRPHYWRLTAFLLVVLVGMFVIWLTAQILIGLAFSAVFGALERGDVGMVLMSLLVAIAQATWTVITSVMLARIYTQLVGPAQADVSVPSSGT